jgi:recombination protein RecA
MATALATSLRSRFELELRGRVASPFTYRDRNAFEVLSTGIPEIDVSLGGLPRGAVTEICGPPCSGRTSVLVSTLASRTAEGEVCALVDARDSFDPYLASAAGVELEKLLWVRCQNIDQALRATDLLIQGGGFGLVAVDLTDIAPQTVRYVPLNAWFRFRRAVEDTPTALILMEQEANAKTCASLVLRLDGQRPSWSETQEAKALDSVRYPFARLLKGFRIGAEVVRSRVQPVTDWDPNHGTSGREKSRKLETFETEARWELPRMI